MIIQPKNRTILPQNGGKTMEEMILRDFARDNDFPFFIQIGDQHGDFFMHTHKDFCELVVVVQGSALHLVEDEVYPVKQGDVFVIC